MSGLDDVSRTIGQLEAVLDSLKDQITAIGAKIDTNDGKVMDEFADIKARLSRLERVEAERHGIEKAAVWFAGLAGAAGTAIVAIVAWVFDHLGK